MVTIKKKRFIFSLTENWFGYRFKLSDFFLPSCYKGLREEVKKKFFLGVRGPSKTIVLNLKESADKIYGEFSTSHKREIKKAEAEGVQCYFKNDRKSFLEFYNDFAKSKNLYTLDTSRPNEFNEEEWRYSFAVANGQLLVVHSYLEDSETGIVRSMQSGSLRLNDKYNPRQISQANKLLHFFDIKYFKERGLKEYDFGGWDDIPGLLEFKESFGAKQIIVYNYYTYAFMIIPKLKKLMTLFKRQHS